MTRNSGKRLSNKKIAIALYLGLVMLVFAGLMTALYLKGKSDQNEPDFQVADIDVVAIIGEYQGNQSSQQEISVESISTVVPNAQVPAWQQFSAQVEKTSLPKIVIIIDDLGLDEEATRTLASMPGPYTLAFLPYAEGLRAQTESIRGAGHELMVHLPMQSHSENADPGRNALLANLTFDEFGRRLEWNLRQFKDYVGVNNHMGSLLTENPALMVRLMARLRSEGLLFVDSLTTPKSVGKRAALAVDVPFLARDVFLDNERDKAYIKRQLSTTERIAQLRGFAIAIGHPYPETLSALQEWQKTLDFRKFTLVPVSQIMLEKNIKK